MGHGPCSFQYGLSLLELLDVNSELFAGLRQPLIRTAPYLYDLESPCHVLSSGHGAETTSCL